jgi:hypothetical protein
MQAPGGYLKNETERAKRLERKFDGKLNPFVSRTVSSPGHFTEISNILKRAWHRAFSSELPQAYLKTEGTARDAMEKCELKLLNISFARNNDLYARAKNLERSLLTPA